MMRLAFFSLTGQTRRFIRKIGWPAFEINPADPLHDLNEPYVLIVPTYEIDITECVNEFIEYGNNLKNLMGVVGGGNRNFAELYIFTAKDIARDYHVPLLYDFEFNGTPDDVTNLKKVVANLVPENNR